MSLIHGTTEASGTKDLVVSVYEKVSRIAYQYRCSLPGCSHKDLVSVAMAEVVSVAVKGLSNTKFPRSVKATYQRKRAYLLVAARRAMARQYRDGYAELLTLVSGRGGRGGYSCSGGWPGRGEVGEHTF